MTNVDKLIKKFKKAVNKAWDNGENEGWKMGYASGLIDGHAEGYEEGVEAYKEHIQVRLKYSEELAMNAGKGAEAARMREMAKFLAFEYDPEKAAQDIKDADGNW